MGRHAFRGVLSAWMVLIVLRTVGTAGGSGRLASAFADVDKLVTRALSSDVPAIPDRRPGDTSQLGYITPAQAAAGAKVAANLPGIDAVTSPGGALGGLPSLQQYVNGGGLAGVVNNPALR